tara:strand:+ start:447 stop:614 length:168 start_codon:yes stop_codon:yes gene_type:complete
MIISVKKSNHNNEFENYLVHFSNGQISYVPLAEDNTDYQNILKWVEEGNTIEEAD